jgi:hypothetical protein
MKKSLVKSQIVSVEQHNKTKSTFHYWREAGVKKFLGIFIVERWNSGYVSWGGSFGDKEEWESENYVEYAPGAGLYYKPHLILVTSDGQQHRKFFNSVEELEKWRDYKLYGISLIKI